MIHRVEQEGSTANAAAQLFAAGERMVRKWLARHRCRLEEPAGLQDR